MGNLLYKGVDFAVLKSKLFSSNQTSSCIHVVPVDKNNDCIVCDYVSYHIRHELVISEDLERMYVDCSKNSEMKNGIKKVYLQLCKISPSNPNALMHSGEPAFKTFLAGSRKITAEIRQRHRLQC